MRLPRPGLGHSPMVRDPECIGTVPTCVLAPRTRNRACSAVARAGGGSILAVGTRGCAHDRPQHDRTHATEVRAWPTVVGDARQAAHPAVSLGPSRVAQRSGAGVAIAAHLESGVEPSPLPVVRIRPHEDRSRSERPSMPIHRHPQLGRRTESCPPARDQRRLAQLRNNYRDPHRLALRRLCPLPRGVGVGPGLGRDASARRAARQRTSRPRFAPAALLDSGDINSTGATALHADPECRLCAMR